MDKCKEFSPCDVGGVVMMVTNGMHLACGRLECIRHPRALCVPVPGDPSAWRTEHLAVAFYCSQLLPVPMSPRDACDVMDVQWKVYAAGPPDVPGLASLVKPAPLCKRFNVDMESFGPTQVPPEVVRSIRRCRTFRDCQDLVLLTRKVNAGVRKAIDCVLRAGGVPVAAPPAPPATCGVDFGEDAAPAFLDWSQPGNLYRITPGFQELAEASPGPAVSLAHEEVLRLVDDWIPMYSLLEPDECGECAEGGPT